MAGSVVQTVGTDSGSAGATLASGSFGSNVTANNFLLITATCASTDASLTISVNSGTATLGTITQRESQTEAGTGNQTKWFTCQITGSGSLNVLATWGSSHAQRGISCAEISGVNAYQVSSSGNDSGNNPTTNISATVSTAPAFIVMTGVDVGSNSTLGTDTTDSYIGDTATGTGTQFKCSTQHKSVATTGSKSGNFTNAGFNRNNTGIIIFTEGAVGAQNQLAWMRA